MFGAAFVNIFLLLAGYFIVAVFDQLLIDLRGGCLEKRPDPRNRQTIEIEFKIPEPVKKTFPFVWILYFPA